MTRQLFRPNLAMPVTPPVRSTAGFDRLDKPDPAWLVDWGSEGRVIVERIDQPGRPLRASGQQLSILPRRKQKWAGCPVFARNDLHIIVRRPKSNGFFSIQSDELEYVAEEHAFESKLSLFIRAGCDDAIDAELFELPQRNRNGLGVRLDIERRRVRRLIETD
jgi:hypothetical protein